jgi:hypothetical protein
VSSPPHSPIAKVRLPGHKWAYHIPPRPDAALIIEGIYVLGLVALMLWISIQLQDPAGFPVVLSLLGVAVLIGGWRVIRVIWRCCSERVLTLGANEIILEHRLRGWRNVQRLTTSMIRDVRIQRSRWSGRRKTILFLEFTTPSSSMRFGHDLSWDEKYWLGEEAKGFLRPFAPQLINDNSGPGDVATRNHV